MMIQHLSRVRQHLLSCTNRILRQRTSPATTNIHVQGFNVRQASIIIFPNMHQEIMSAQSVEFGFYNDTIHQQLEAIVGEKGISTSQAVRDQHGRDESYHSCLPADAVLFPASVEEVGKVLALCNKERIPVVPYGTGTGLEGGIGAVKVGEINIYTFCNCNDKNYIDRFIL